LNTDLRITDIRNDSECTIIVKLKDNPGVAGGFAPDELVFVDPHPMKASAKKFYTVIPKNSARFYEIETAKYILEKPPYRDTHFIVEYDTYYESDIEVTFNKKHVE